MKIKTKLFHPIMPNWLKQRKKWVTSNTKLSNTEKHWDIIRKQLT
uniref:Uncharacterized protein n=1 Tax=Rhodnius prolixus TaxID=13249 RepID=T1IBV9_RHOPR